MVHLQEPQLTRLPLHVLLFVFALCSVLMTGCGKGQYDQRMETRIQQLRTKAESPEPEEEPQAEESQAGENDESDEGDDSAEMDEEDTDEFDDESVEDPAESDPANESGDDFDQEEGDK